MYRGISSSRGNRVIAALVLSAGRGRSPTVASGLVKPRWNSYPSITLEMLKGGTYQEFYQALSRSRRGCHIGEPDRVARSRPFYYRGLPHFLELRDCRSQLRLGRGQGAGERARSARGRRAGTRDLAPAARCLRCCVPDLVHHGHSVHHHVHRAHPRRSRRTSRLV